MGEQKRKRHTLCHGLDLLVRKVGGHGVGALQQVERVVLVQHRVFVLKLPNEAVFEELQRADVLLFDAGQQRERRHLAHSVPPCGLWWKGAREGV